MQTQHVPGEIPISSPPLPGVRPVSRLRVLHVVSCLGIGGTEHGVLKIIEGLGHAEFEHKICAVRGVDENFVRQRKIPVGVSSAGSTKPGLQFPLFRLMRLMKAFRPHIVHTRNFGAIEAIAAARLSGVPVAIHSEHGYELEILGGLPLRRRLICRALYAIADQVCTVTGDLRDYHSKQSWLPAKRFRVIYNGVNTDQFSPRPELTMSLRAEFGLPMGRIIIGSVGRLVPIKNLKTLLQAAEAVIHKGHDVHVLIVGSGPELPNLQAHVAASPGITERVRFLEASDRVSDLLNSMDIFVLSSISEGMSNTILEAMASGLPVVVSRAGGNPELVEGGRVGRLFNPRDVEALASHLSELAGQAALRSKYGLAARQRAEDEFSLPVMIKNYRDLYMDLASRCGVRKG